MSPIDRGYYEARIAQERVRAARAPRPEIRHAHAELARRYEALLASPSRVSAS